MKYEKVYGFKPSRFEIVEDVQVADEVEDSARAEVMAAQKEVEMKEAAAKMEKNQKLLEDTMRQQVESESKSKETVYKNEEEAAKARAQNDLKYSKKFGFQPNNFAIVNENDLTEVQLSDERYKPGTILDYMENIDPRSSSEK